MGALVIEGFILSAMGSVVGIVLGVARIEIVERDPGHRPLHGR